MGAARHDRRTLRRDRLLAIGCRDAPWLGPRSAVPPSDDLARELPRIKPLEPADGARVVPDPRGFRLEPVAVEPLVTDPVSVCYDADGRLYVVEMRGLSLPREHADRQRQPAGGPRRRRPVRHEHDLRRRPLVADRRRPLRRRRLHRRRARHPLRQGHRRRRRGRRQEGRCSPASAPRTSRGCSTACSGGPTAGSTASSGGNGGEIQNLTRPDAKPVSVRGRDFRFKPDGSAFEAISGGGQFGHSLRRLGPPVHLQQQQPHPPDRPARPRPRAEPGAASTPAVIDRHRRRRGGGAGLPDQPARALAGRPHPPARGRPGDASSGCRRPSCVADRLLHLGHRRDDLPRRRPSRPSTAATPSSATSAATSSTARS